MKTLSNQGVKRQWVFECGNVLKMVREISSYLRDVLVTNRDIVRITITVIEKE